MRRGVTLIELLVVVVMLGFIIAGAVRALAVAVEVELRLRDGTREAQRLAAFEREVGDLLKQAFLPATPSETAYFIGTAAGSTLPTPGTILGQGAGAFADEVTFTAVGIRPRLAALESDADFEELNATFGPQGGPMEVSISTFGINVPDDRSGIFLRTQRPADGDPSQGGRQRLWLSEITSIQFEFFDGLEWRPTWDSRGNEQNRLPAAVRVTYRPREQDADRVFVVRLLHSDATPNDPVPAGGTL